MEQRASARGQSNRLPYPQDHIPSKIMGLSASRHAHTRQNRFIRGIISSHSYIISDTAVWEIQVK